MDNMFSNNLTSIDQEIMDFTDELLRRYDTRNNRTFRNREPTPNNNNRNHNEHDNPKKHHENISVITHRVKANDRIVDNRYLK